MSHSTQSDIQDLSSIIQALALSSGPLPNSTPHLCPFSISRTSQSTVSNSSASEIQVLPSIIQPEAPSSEPITSHSTQSDTQSLPSIIQPLAFSREPLPNPLLGTLRTEDKSFFQSAFSDVFKGVWMCDVCRAETTVCIKVLRKIGVRDSELGLTEEERFERRIRREMLIWRAATHRNVVRFLGYQMIKEVPWLVSPWIDKKSLVDYVRAAQVSRAKRLNLLRDAATGLEYLHGLKPWIAHGDLKPENILVLDDCTAALCDFGTSRVMADLQGHTGLTTASSAAGTVAYQAKELILGHDHPTPSSDIYALGGVILWTMSGKEPFYQEKTKGGVVIAICGDKKCDRIHHPDWEADDLLWEFLSQCWDPEPKSRPNVLQVLHELDAAESRLGDPPPYTEGANEIVSS